MDSFERTFTIDPQQAVFIGHFPDNPILPGVLTLSFIKAAVAEYFGTSYKISCIKKQKFTGPVFPGAQLRLIFQIRSQDTQEILLDVLGQIDGETASSIKLTLCNKDG